MAGLIGTNKSDSAATVEKMLEDREKLKELSTSAKILKNSRKEMLPGEHGRPYRSNSRRHEIAKGSLFEGG